jgi:hypothetical protein
MKKLTLLLFCISFLASAQEKDPAVELPRFVITGKQTFSFPPAEKIDPELVSILSDEFLTPVYAPVQLEVKKLAEDTNPSVRFSDSLNYRNGKLSLLAGNAKLPEVSLTTAFPGESNLFRLLLFANRRAAFIDYADKFSYGGSARFDHFINHNASFLPGGELSIGTGFKSSGYNFYGAPNPETDRSTAAFDFTFAFENLLDKNVTYGFDITWDIFSASDNLQAYRLYNQNFSLLDGDHDEVLFGANGYLNILFSSFELQTDFHLNSQFFANPYFDFSGNNFYAFRGIAGFDISKVLKVQGGFEYSEVDTLSKFNPIARMILQINRYFSVIGEFAPSSEFVTNKALFAENPYYYPITSGYVFFEKESALSAALKYEYSRFFEIGGGLRYYRSDRHPYFNDAANQGYFNVGFTEADFYGGFFHLLFHPGPNGVFYAEIDLHNVSDNNGNTLPYYPDLEAFASYGYAFDEQWTLKPVLTYRSAVYTDIQNTNSIDGFIDMSLITEYALSDAFQMKLELNNILNQSTYYWKNYEQPGLNAQIGFDYRW